MSFIPRKHVIEEPDTTVQAVLGLEQMESLLQHLDLTKKGLKVLGPVKQR